MLAKKDDNSNVKRGQHKTKSCDKLDKNVQGWPHGVLERVSNLRSIRQHDHMTNAAVHIFGSQDITVSPVTAAL
jgi:hypothetical protein